MILKGALKFPSCCPGSRRGVMTDDQAAFLILNKMEGSE
jgi:hypothetical protein